jgi:hypothetical protein
MILNSLVWWCECVISCVLFATLLQLPEWMAVRFSTGHMTVVGWKLPSSVNSLIRCCRSVFCVPVRLKGRIKALGVPGGAVLQLADLPDSSIP